MKRIRTVQAHGLGSSKDEGIFSKNHFASTAVLSASVREQIANLNLYRVAGSIYECQSDREFWKVKGNKIIRLVDADEVDSGQSIPAAPKNEPMAFLESIMNELEF